MRTNWICLLSAFLLAVAAEAGASAQEIIVPEGYVLVDSLVYRPAPAVDTTLTGKDIFSLVRTSQTPAVTKAMKSHVEMNASRTISGYRVRIFFDNKQSSRTESEATLKKFEGLYHGVPAYRTYANPYFKVTVGDFRTKSEAMEMLTRIRRNFPAAFVVKENISFPVVDRENAFVVDTVKVLKQQ